MENGSANNKSLDAEEQPPIRSVFSLKNKKRTREIEKIDDCFILNFDPHETLNPFQIVNQDIDAPDITVVAEHGKVACRDYPHSRHQCLQYPFSKTPHETHCKLCYCYVCDIVAPCAEWSDHCHAAHSRSSHWCSLRRGRRGHDFDSDSDSDNFA